MQPTKVQNKFKSRNASVKPNKTNINGSLAQQQDSPKLEK